LAIWGARVATGSEAAKQMRGLKIIEEVASAILKWRDTVGWRGFGLCPLA